MNSQQDGPRVGMEWSIFLLLPGNRQSIRRSGHCYLSAQDRSTLSVWELHCFMFCWLVFRHQRASVLPAGGLISFSIIAVARNTGISLPHCHSGGEHLTKSPGVNSLIDSSDHPIIWKIGLAASLLSLIASGELMKHSNIAWCKLQRKPITPN